VSETPPALLQLTHPLLSVWREAGVLQIGCEGRWFVLRDVPELLPQVIELLALPHTPAELCALVPGLDPEWIGWLCQHLSSAGLLTRRSAAARPVLVCGRGRLAATVLSMLRVAGLHPRQVPSHSDLLPADALLVVAAGTAEPDRTLLNRLTRSGLEHLVVRAEPARAVAGPLVEPATGPCVRCDDLARAQRDRGWPVLLAQLCTTEVEPDAGLVAWAAATATTAVRARLAGAASELAGRTLELGVSDFRLRSRTWPRQPDCGCHGEAFSRSGTLAG
jgi:bacteriocin biosynthesis cyclodehydratase domain-containing protein